MAIDKIPGVPMHALVKNLQTLMGTGLQISTKEVEEAVQEMIDNGLLNDIVNKILDKRAQATAEQLRGEENLS